MPRLCRAMSPMHWRAKSRGRHATAPVVLTGNSAPSLNRANPAKGLPRALSGVEDFGDKDLLQHIGTSEDEYSPCQSGGRMFSNLCSLASDQNLPSLDDDDGTFC